MTSGPSTLDPRHILSHARAMMIEQIMALIGRASPDPQNYRRTLNLFETETLQRKLNDLREIYPAPPSLTDNAGVIASADTGVARLASRETLILQSSLP